MTAAIARTHPLVRRYLTELMRHAGPAPRRECAELTDALADHVDTVVRRAPHAPDRAVLAALAELGEPRTVAQAMGWTDRGRERGGRAVIVAALIGCAAGGPFWHAHPAAVALVDLVLTVVAAAVLASPLRPRRPGRPPVNSRP
ncbi:hypothetical protein C6N75_01930 [Streptomyces solincola]|uniref:Uncharacterized protein n=1 Tax=Streptomyces solincola TaxID=2100817 RepID=A0A2S9Q2D3_9ACTN|nr:hypothetical protein [Streptomyces solincola]PRH80834.1 hypothetical protein C6N75_01930 [Streptomyces solincola]